MVSRTPRGRLESDRGRANRHFWIPNVTFFSATDPRIALSHWFANAHRPIAARHEGGFNSLNKSSRKSPCLPGKPLVDAPEGRLSAHAGSAILQLRRRIPRKGTPFCVRNVCGVIPVITLSLTRPSPSPFPFGAGGCNGNLTLGRLPLTMCQSDKCWSPGMACHPTDDRWPMADGRWPMADDRA
jgi:hypothetical protein